MSKMRKAPVRVRTKSKEDKQRAVAMYLAGKTAAHIAGKIGVTSTAVYKWLKAAGVFVPKYAPVDKSTNLVHK